MTAMLGDFWQIAITAAHVLCKLVEKLDPATSETISKCII